VLQIWIFDFYHPFNVVLANLGVMFSVVNHKSECFFDGHVYLDNDFFYQCERNFTLDCCVFLHIIIFSLVRFGIKVKFITSQTDMPCLVISTYVKKRRIKS
jgi:hypothetical protein